MEHVSTDKNKNMIQNICNKNEGVSLYAMRLLFFVDYKNRLICPNTAFGSMHLCPLCFSPSLEHSSSLAFCLYLLSL